MQFKVPNLGEFLKNARKEKGFTISNVAEDLSLSSGYISRIENNTSVPSFNVLNALCNKYMISIKDVVAVDFLDKKDASLLDINIADVMMSDNIKYYDRELSVTDKINILEFVDFFTSCKDTNLKANVMGIIKSLNIK